MCPTDESAVLLRNQSPSACVKGNGEKQKTGKRNYGNDHIEEVDASVAG